MLLVVMSIHICLISTCIFTYRISEVPKPTVSQSVSLSFIQSARNFYSINYRWDMRIRFCGLICIYGLWRNESDFNINNTRILIITIWDWLVEALICLWLDRFEHRTSKTKTEMSCQWLFFPLYILMMTNNHKNRGVYEY